MEEFTHESANIGDVTALSSSIITIKTRLNNTSETFSITSAIKVTDGSTSGSRNSAASPDLQTIQQ